MAALSYTIDTQNTIIAVGGAWDDFARNNDGEKIVSTQIIGKKLNQFIHGDETRMFVLTMIMSARILNRPVNRPYRCDSPTLKRFMSMTVQPLGAGAVEVSHQELRSEPITHTVHMVAAPAGSGTHYAKRCSMCNRIKLEGVWSEVDDAVNAKRLVPTAAPAVKVIYGVCPDCASSRTGGATGVAS